MIESLIEKAGLYANLAGVTAIISGLALFIFFAGVRIFGPINDATSVVQNIFLIPVALALYQLLRSQSPSLSLAAMVFGILAMLVFAALQTALVFGQVRFEQSLPYVLFTSGVVGLWLLANGLLALRVETYPGGLAWVGILAGLGYLLGLAGFWLGGQQHPLAAIGFVAAFVAVPVWCLWLGRLFNSGSLPLPA